MKHITRLCLLVLMVLLVQFFAVQAMAGEAIPTVYLDAVSGQDTNDGLTADTAVKTLDAAYGKLSARGKIVLVTDYTITMTAENQTITTNTHGYEVIITGKTADTKLIVSTSEKNIYLGLQGPTTFENITMNVDGNPNACIYGNGGHVKIGNNVKTTSTTKFKLSAGPLRTGYVGDMSLEVNSGNWQDLCAGAYMYTMNGNGSLVMNGGSVVNLEVTYNGKHTGDVTITINGGTITNLYGGSRHKNGVLTGDITVYWYDGTIKNLDIDGLGTINGTSKLVKPEAKDLALQYDDRKDLASLVGYTAGNVTISNEQVTSCQVGTTTKDEHVIIYEDGKIIATGIGTADLKVGSVTHKVTVTPATISMFMITGHSVGAGDGGAIGQSVLCEAGQVYSSHRPYAITSGEGGLGYGSAVRAGCKDSSGNTVDISNQQHLDAFTAEGVGTTGEGSAFGYQWNKLTGEKVWILNFAVGGSCLNEWQTGVKGHATWTEYHYDTAIKSFSYAQTVVKNEIAAGHYTFGHMAMLYHNGVNYSNYPGWTYEKIEADYAAMWNGYKAALATDMDGDGTEETLEGLGLVPFYNFLNEYDDHFDKPAGYYMASSAEYPDVFLASNVYFNWMRLEGLSSFPVPNYSVQNGSTLKVPDSIAHEANGGTSTNSVFCKADNMHPTQVVHNATGMQLANSMYSYLHDAHETTSLTLQNQAHNPVSHLDLVVGESKHLVAMITPNCKGNVTYEAQGAVSIQYPLQVVGNEIGTGTIIARAGDTILATVTVTVTENTHVHCLCGMQDACVESVSWTAWGDDAYEQNVLPFLSGNYYLAADITVNKSMLAEPGETIRICLNGHTINTGSERVANNQGNMLITDCAETQGTLTSQYSSKYAQILYNYSGAQLDIYGGNLIPTGQSAWGGAILSHGTVNLYGGTVYGGTNAKVDTLEARGGAIYIISGQVNLYGGTVIGGSATKGGAIYMDSSTLVIDGATITSGNASLGGNIYADYLSKIEIKDGLIENGTSKNQGGNLYLYTSAKDNKARDCSLKISGGVIQNGIANDRGSNIFVTTGATANPGVWDITVTGGQLIGGKDNVILRNNAALSLSGGSITSQGNSVLFEKSVTNAPTPVLKLKDSFVLDKVHMEAYNGLIRLESEKVSSVTVTGMPTIGFYGMEGNYSISANISHLSLNPSVTGFGYKAEFTFHDALNDLLVNQGYNLWLDESHVLTRSVSTFRDALTLRLNRFDIENYGSAKVNANVYMQFNNGLRVESQVVSYSMQDMVEMISADLTKYDASQIQLVQTMLEGYTAVESWNIPELLAWNKEI